MMFSDILHSVNTFLNFDDRNNMNFSNGNLLQGITFVNISNQKKERIYPELKYLQIRPRACRHWYR